MKAKIDCKGNVHAVYNDKLRELFPGSSMEMQRASNVEFNHTTQEWEAATPGGEVIAHGINRDAVIQEEIKVIESRL